jgi:hypothetical protein
VDIVREEGGYNELIKGYEQSYLATNSNCRHNSFSAERSNGVIANIGWEVNLVRNRRMVTSESPTLWAKQREFCCFSLDHGFCGSMPLQSLIISWKNGENSETVMTRCVQKAHATGHSGGLRSPRKTRHEQKLLR